MNKGPQGQKRPADVVGCAVTVAKIATGEIDDVIGKPRQMTKAKGAILASAVAQSHFHQSAEKK